ncbi:MAG TPA: biotin/lipoyl-containing protein [Kofleriaceae bacterium]|nr:biotin/lipoyl-containing protein [Kofleriaceae bacterium]
MRQHAPAVTAAARAAGDRVELTSPAPGLFRIAVHPGDLVRPGGVLGRLEVLGQLAEVVVPEGVHGAVAAVCGEGLARPAVDFGAVLVTVDPRALAAESAAAAGRAATTAAAAEGVAGRVFRAPTSGRFYGSPSPGKPPFVAQGDELLPGTTICLLEVMKTFHRVTYGGEPARVGAVLVTDGADVNAGDPLLALE